MLIDVLRLASLNSQLIKRLRKINFSILNLMLFIYLLNTYSANYWNRLNPNKNIKRQKKLFIIILYNLNFFCKKHKFLKCKSL